MKENTSLGELVQHSNKIEEQIINAGGEITPELEKELDLVGSDLAVKVDNYCHLIDRTKTMSEYWANQAKELQAISRSCKNFSVRLKERIKMALLEGKKSEIVGHKKRFLLSNTAARLVIDETTLDKTYLMEVVTHVPDKERIKQTLKAGKKVKGACLQGGVSLRSYANKGV